MQIKPVLKRILTVILVLLAASNAALAAESSDYINELMVSDVFHPPGEPVSSIPFPLTDELLTENKLKNFKNP